MPWSLLRNIESKCLIYPETDLLSVGFVYLSSRSKPKKTICCIPTRLTDVIA